MSSAWRFTAEEPDRIDGRSAAIRIALGHPRADEAEVEDCVEVAIEVARWDEPLEGDDNRSVEIAGFGWAKHGGTSAEATTGRVAYPNLLQPTLFHRAGPFVRRGAYRQGGWRIAPPRSLIAGRIDERAKSSFGSGADPARPWLRAWRDPRSFE